MVIHTLTGFLEMVFPIKTREIDTAVEQLALAEKFRKQGQGELARLAETRASSTDREKSICIEDFEIESMAPCVNFYDIIRVAVDFYRSQGYKTLENPDRKAEFPIFIKGKSRIGLVMDYLDGVIWTRAVDLS